MDLGNTFLVIFFFNEKKINSETNFQATNPWTTWPRKQEATEVIYFKLQRFWFSLLLLRGCPSVPLSAQALQLLKMNREKKRKEKRSLQESPPGGHRWEGGGFWQSESTTAPKGDKERISKSTRQWTGGETTPCYGGSLRTLHGFLFFLSFCI